MQKLIYLLFTIVFLIAAGITFLLIAAPTDLIRDQITSLVKQKTGRDLIINGETSFSVFPSLGLQIRDVALSGPASNPRRLLLKMEGLRANVSLLPLIRQKIEVNSFVLDQPQFDLWVDRKGVPSWEFASGANSDVMRQAHRNEGPRLIRVSNDQLPPELQEFVRNSSGGKQALQSAQRLEGLFKDLSLEKVSINKGALRYEDQRTGAKHLLEGIDLRLGLSDLANPLNADGGFLWQRERVTFDGRLASPIGILNGKNSELALNIGGERLSAKFNGSIAVMGGFRADGNLSAKTPAVDGLLNWLAAGSGQSLGGAASLQSAVSADQSGAHFKKVKLSLRGVDGDGDISVNINGDRPSMRGTLHFALLDISQLLSSNPGRSAAGGAPSGGTSDPDRQVNQEPAQISGGGAGSAGRPVNSAGAGWSRAPIVAAGLNAINAQLVATVDRLQHDKLKITDSRLVTLLDNGQLRINIEKASLYGGRGTGRISVDGARRVPKLSASMLINNVSALPLLKDAADFGWIDGRGQIAVNISGQGASQHAMVNSMAGDGRINFSDGAIVGVNIPQMIRGFQAGNVTGVTKNDTQKTDFSELSGTFTITKGIASNRDLRLIGPLVRMDGAGVVDIPRKYVDYKLMPKLVASLAGQGGGSTLGGIEIPVRVQGPWSAPSIVPDLAGLVNNPDQAVESAKKIFKGFKKQMDGNDVEGIVKGIFGGQ